MREGGYLIVGLLFQIWCSVEDHGGASEWVVLAMRIIGATLTLLAIFGGVS